MVKGVWQKMAALPVFRSFVSEKEIEEVKQKRQEEWEKVRKPDQPLERPEEAYDPRTLYDRLKQQKDKKQEEHDDQYKFKNMIYKGLDDDEAKFLNFVSERQSEKEDAMYRQEIEEITEYREAVSKLKDEEESERAVQSTAESGENDSAAAAAAAATNQASATTGSKPGSGRGLVQEQKGGRMQHKSQLALIAGSIKTKRKRTTSREDSDSVGESSPEKKQKLDSVGQTPPAATSGALTTLLAAYSSGSDSED